MSAGLRDRALHPERVDAARHRLNNGRIHATLAETFSGLADTNRVKIIDSLMVGEMCVSDLSVVLGISESAVSQHLRILRNLRWVRHRKSGRIVYYALEDEHIRSLLELSLAHAGGR